MRKKYYAEATRVEKGIRDKEYGYSSLKLISLITWYLLLTTLK